MMRPHPKCRVLAEEPVRSRSVAVLDDHVVPKAASPHAKRPERPDQVLARGEQPRHGTMVIEAVADEHREPLDLVDLMGPIDPVAIDSLAVQRCQEVEAQQDATRIVQSRHARRDDGVSVPDSRRGFTLDRGQLIERHEDLGSGRKLHIWADVLVHERVDAICDRVSDRRTPLQPTVRAS